MKRTFHFPNAIATNPGFSVVPTPKVAKVLALEAEIAQITETFEFMDDLCLHDMRRYASEAVANTQYPTVLQSLRKAAQAS